jgi:hypothetical protein
MASGFVRVGEKRRTLTMWHQRIAVRSALAWLILLLCAAPGVADDSDIKLKGFAEVPGSSLTLPLPDGAPPVIIDVTFGVPAVTIPVEITPSTKIKSKSGTVLLADGDAVKIKAAVVGSVLSASRLELEDFPELELTGVVEELPPAGVDLPLAPGTTLDLVVSLGTSGIDVPVVLTSSTKIKNAPTLQNGDLVRVEAVVRGGVIVVTKLKAGDDDDDDDEDDD